MAVRQDMNPIRWIQEMEHELKKTALMVKSSMQSCNQESKTYESRVKFRTMEHITESKAGTAGTTESMEQRST